MKKANWRTNHRALFNAVLLSLLVMQVKSGGVVVASQADKTWTQTVLVPAGQSKAIESGAEGAHIQVYGNLTVKSCCGYSTNDIIFQIYDVGGSVGHNYGVVASFVTFDFNTGPDDAYLMTFDNKWLKCGSDGICSPDSTNPSYHNKTIIVAVREVIGSTFGLPLTIYIALTIAVITVTGMLVARFYVMKKRTKVHTSEPAARSV